MPEYKDKSLEELRWEDYQIREGTLKRGSAPPPILRFAAAEPPFLGVGVTPASSPFAAPSAVLNPFGTVPEFPFAPPAAGSPFFNAFKTATVAPTMAATATAAAAAADDVGNPFAVVSSPTRRRPGSPTVQRRAQQEAAEEAAAELPAKDTAAATPGDDERPLRSAARLRCLASWSWEQAAAEFDVAEKAEAAAGAGSLFRCNSIMRMSLESATAEAQRREEEVHAAAAALEEQRASVEADRPKAQAARERISELERELEQQRAILRGAEARIAMLAEAEKRAAEAEEAKRKADDQLAIVRKVQEVASARQEAFAVLVRKRDLSLFGVKDSGDLLQELGLGMHRSKFEREGIDGTALALLDSASMQELGIGSLVERKRLMHAVQLITRIGVVRLTAAAILQATDTTAREDLLVATWGPKEVSQWLQDRGIPAETCAALSAAGVNGEMLLNLQQNDLREVCSKMGDRIKILSMSEQVRERFYAAAVQVFAKQQTGEPSSSSMPTAETAPEEFLCPITQAVMRDPVLASDGFSYERSAIERWLADHSTSPATGAPLEDKTLRPEHTLRSATKAWLEKHNRK